MVSKAPGLSLLGAHSAWRDVTALAFTAGAVDSIGLSVVGRYTAHMSGTTSSLAGALVGRQAIVVVLCVVALLAFLIGATLSGLLIAASPTSEPRQVAARALALEAVLIAAATPILLFLGHGGTLGTDRVVLPLAMAMGLQNRTGVYLAGGKARTTHVTGTLTDLGYHVGRLLRRTSVARATRDKDRAAVLRMVGLFGGFLVGGLSGRLASLAITPFAPALFALTPLVLAGRVRRAHPNIQPLADDP